ncbi:hypothetical protein [Paraflavitalea pollutisoli]|uniref:hypothetical protein n=1 Tax=Paraflavitalea pollutisoli TaxID=3034143 RepID=UPI0023EC0BA0|nr:hypothetical protein [Paraflavitalea sp. H1-2-19X]
MMEDKDLKAAWQGTPPPPTNQENIRKMMIANNHPVQQAIRKQLIIETLAFTGLLAVYYNIFDGHEKPLFANILLVAALLVAILHNIIGYRFSRQQVRGNNLQQSLTAAITKWRNYAIGSIASRAVTATCLLVFFTTIIQLTPVKTWLLVGAIVVCAGQLLLLIRLWVRRISQLKQATGYFKD